MRPANNIRSCARLRITAAFAVLISAVTLVLCTATLTSAQAVYPSWSYTGNLNNARVSHTTTLLPNGKILIAGGFGVDCPPSCGYLSSAELYDPATGTWSFTGDLNRTRAYHTATLLSNGKVLVAGGVVNENVGTIQTAELYDPATGIWSRTGNLNRLHYGHTATLLPNGKVLVAGGYSAGNSAELYDPVTGTWSITGNLNSSRGGHTATLLPNGTVLVVASGVTCDDCPPVPSSEIYDPATGTWNNTGSLNTGRELHTATLLPNGKVLIVGGLANGVPLRSAELYDPATGMWSNIRSLNFPRYYHTATLLQNGKVLIAAGTGFSSAELYDPDSGTWRVTAYPNVARGNPAATLLSNGKVLVSCGSAPSPFARTTELYDLTGSPTFNFIDDAQFFAHEHYADFLQRESDPDGLAFWTKEIASCGNDQRCIELKRINVSAAFYLSIEFQQTGYFVYLVHKAAHGNLPGAPVPVKLDDFLAETAQVGSGVIVGQPGWEQTLESNKQYFLYNPDEGNDRFTSGYPASMTPGELVDALFSNAGITPSGTDRTAAINEFGSATTTADIAARARALRRVAENLILKQQEFNKAFVLMQYFGYLRRNPNDPPEPTLDFQGYNFWLTKLNQFNGNFVNAEMVKAFLVSTEYRQRFSQP